MNAFLRKIKDIICFSLVMSFIYITITKSREIKLFSYDAIINCLTNLIPSLYFNLSIALFVVKSNLYLSVGKVFRYIAKYIFAMPDYIFSVFLISSFSGYPVGTKILKDLNSRKIISDYEMRYLPSICFSCGPAFIFSVVCDFKIGCAIFLTIFLANIISAIFICNIYKPKFYRFDYSYIKLNLKIDVFFESLSESFKSVINISFITVFFSVFISLVSLKLEISIISPLFEICSLYDSFSFDYLGIFLSIFYISFGGVCVLLQVIKISENKLSVPLFIFTRLFNAALAILFFILLIRFNIVAIPENLTYCFLDTSIINQNGLGISYFSLLFPLMSVMIIKKLEDLARFFGDK